MCDIQLRREGGRTWFAKNSDREPGEPQLVVALPAARGDRAATVRTTYLEVPETADRHALLLSKPAWIWGAELGANDQGLVIGNTAVFSQVTESAPGLIGMDLLRLGLERAATARAAIDVITALLTEYGQGGPCGYRDKGFSYDNSFILADADEAWVLESAGRHWVARRIERYWATSNWMTIGAEYDLASPGIADYARHRGLLARGATFDFARCFQQRFLPRAAGAPWRWRQSMACLAAEQPDAGWTRALLAHLRSHRRGGDSALLRNNDDVCMHAGGFIRRSQTCGTMLSILGPGKARHFLTGTSAPCLAIIKPAAPGEAGWGVVHPDGRAVEDSLWSRHEQVHRRALFAGELRARVRETRDRTESALLAPLGPEGDEGDDAALGRANDLAMEWQRQWFERIAALPPLPVSARPYRRFWQRVD